MLTRKDEYRWVGANALQRIAIEGKPYPVRTQKLVLLGEDIAYLWEALQERRYCAGGIPTTYDDAILRVRLDELPHGVGDNYHLFADMLSVMLYYGAFDYATFDFRLQSVLWLNAEEEANFTHSSTEISVIVRDYKKSEDRQTFFDTIAAYETRSSTRKTTYDNAVEDAKQALEDAVDDAESDCEDEIDAAEQAATTALSAERETHQGNLDALASEHERLVDEIEADERYKDDPLAKETALFNEDERYALAVAEEDLASSRRMHDIADAQGVRTENATVARNTAINEAWEDYIEAMTLAGDTRLTQERADIFSTGAALKSIISAEQMSPSDWIDTTDGHGYWESWEPDWLAILEAHTAMRISKSATVEWYSKTPTTEVAEGSPLYHAPNGMSRKCVAYRPSSYEIGRYYRDLESLSAIMPYKSLGPGSTTTAPFADGGWHRNALRVQSQDSLGWGTIRERADGNTDSLLYSYDMSIMPGGTSWLIWDYYGAGATGFFMMYGREGEDDRITRITATVVIAVTESLTEYVEDPNDSSKIALDDNGHQMKSFDKTRNSVHVARVTMTDSGVPQNPNANNRRRWSFTVPTVGVSPTYTPTSRFYQHYLSVRFGGLRLVDVEYSMKTSTDTGQ